MQSQSEITNTKVWNEEEIRDLILFAQSLREENEELRAKIIAMDAYVKNGDAKLRQLQMILKRYTI
jgi:erythromycin esterase-like protein